MKNMLYTIPRSILFRLDPEIAHELTLHAISRVGQLSSLRSVVAGIYGASGLKPVEVFGLKFPNRVGLAAGYDKDGTGWRGLAALGFGHIEIGTVTPEPQPGNPKPRVFRLVKYKSVINRMGFPGRGAEFMVEQLKKKRPEGLILGVNIGKQKSTELDDASNDYRHLVDVFAPLADYLAINISSPNTPGLRRLQERSYLSALLGDIVERRNEVAGRIGASTPLLVKLAPDLSDDQLLQAVDVILESGFDGIIATNTTLSRDKVSGATTEETGGLSGQALTDRSTEIIREIHEHSGGSIPIVGVGGIMSSQDALDKIAAGATLVQLYTGLIYGGPALVSEIAKALSNADQ